MRLHIVKLLYLREIATIAEVLTLYNKDVVLLVFNFIEMNKNEVAYSSVIVFERNYNNCRNTYFVE